MNNKARQLGLSLAGILLIVMIAVLVLVPYSKVLANRASPASWSGEVDAVDPAAGIARLVEAGGGTTQVSISRATGVARFIRLQPGRLALPLNSQALPLEKAMSFFQLYGSAFGMTNPELELALDGIRHDRLGMTRVAFQQVYQGVPVFAGMLYAHFDKAGQLVAVNGAFIPEIKVDGRPTLDADEAAGLAIKMVATDQPRSTLALQAAKNDLVIFRTGLVQGVAGASHLAYQVEVRDETAAIREFLFIDAHTGQLLDQISGIHQALSRRIYLDNPGNLVWKEGDGPYVGNQAKEGVNRLINYAGDTYYLFQSISGGYDSYDNQGAVMHSVYDDPGINCPNALWDGSFTRFCDGVDGDDTVAHEWVHAYTEYTHNLIYQWQPGALNESYSDIFGEIVDVLNGDGLDQPDAPRTAGACSSLAGGSGSDNSYRWLSGEDDISFEGAIRDMWTPGCFGDPGEVIEENYHCRSDDAGGVHHNSGVPNHAFALLVDGGMYNGITVGRIGLTKAAALYWRAMSVYQHPTTDFADHADALENSCRDLIGQEIYDPTTENEIKPSAEQIHEDDCSQVAKAMEAVEMRQDPVAHCGFQPLLQDPPPPLCGSAIGPVTQVYSQTFEINAGDWTTSTTVASGSVEPLTWVLTDTLPSDRAGAAFLALNEQGGCGLRDDSRVMHLDSPEILLPDNAKYPRVSFWHWLATEAEYDGGNFKIRVNGGPWQLVAGQHYTFNAYNMSLLPAEESSNPLASQEAFSGADEGLMTGSWGQSQVNISAYAGPGDRIQLRFDFGSDECAGLYGWYVDDVELYYCQDKELFMPAIQRD